MLIMCALFYTYRDKFYVFAENYSRKIENKQIVLLPRDD